MELVTSLNGTVAIDVLNDDVKPEQDFMVRDLVEYLTSTYQFAIKPNIPEGMPPSLIPSYTFQSGFMTSDNKKLPIIQMSMIANGDIATAATTEAADIIIDDLMAKLEKDFGFRYSTAKKRRVYLCNVVIKFAKGVEEKIDAIKKIETILGQEIKRPNEPFKIKRLAFGHGNIEMQPTMTIEAMEKADFILERRTGSPYSENRYYCSAPVQTSELVKILEKIEKELS